MANPVQIQISVAPSFANIAEAFRSTDIKKQVNDWIERFAKQTESYSKQITPVDTGRLRASIGTFLFPSSLSGRVGTNVEYAVFVHEGTRRMRSRPFMREGAELAQRKIGGEDLANRLDKEFRRKFAQL